MRDDLPTRKRIRLPDFDYGSAGYYFVTICAKEKQCLFGTVVGAGVLDGPHIVLSPYGEVVRRQLEEVNETPRNIRIDKYVIMPNHVHLIAKVNGSSRTPTPTNAAIPAFISMLKRFTDRKCGTSLWQRSYYDHVIRDEADYLRIWQYIDDNPVKWAEDEYYQA